MTFTTVADAFAQIGISALRPLTESCTRLSSKSWLNREKTKYRKGTILIPQLLVWLVLTLTLRRDLNCQKVLNWLVSGFRWMHTLLPARSKLVQGWCD